MNKLLKRIMVAAMVITVFMGFSINALAAAKANTEVMNEEMLNKINELRATHDLPALNVDTDLVSYAQIRANEITKKFSHTRPDGTEGLDIIPLSKSYAGENLSWHVMDQGVDAAVEGTFTALVNSPSHLENMIAPEYTKIGIASVEFNGRMYVAYMFSN
jgi:uncharacterized protein YkwD